MLCLAITKLWLPSHNLPGWATTCPQDIPARGPATAAISAAHVSSQYISCLRSKRAPLATQPLLLRHLICVVIQVTQAAAQNKSKDAGVRAEITKRIKSLGESGRAREAVTQMAEMARMGVQPDTQAGTALLHACVRNGQIDMAQTVFDELFGA